MKSANRSIKAQIHITLKANYKYEKQLGILFISTENSCLKLLSAPNLAAYGSTLVFSSFDLARTSGFLFVCLFCFNVNLNTFRKCRYSTVSH